MDHAGLRSAIEEEERQLSSFAIDGASLHKLGNAILKTASAPVVVRIVIAGRTVFHAAQDGTALDNERFCELKINTVLRTGHSSLWWHHYLRATDRTLKDVIWADPHLVSDLGGGFPLSAQGQIVGAIAVSGLPHESDHTLITDALRRLSAIKI